LMTPMLIVMLAIGTTDVLFALDSIPAIFGLTQDPYIVFTANAFALMGLRQLYFLIGGLLKKLVHLSYGLSIILGFIGVKLVL
ncbi:TerC family protein, partial [Streptomyces sp. URMC 126]